VTRFCRIAAIGLLLASPAACSGNSASPTSPSTTRSTEMFTGTLAAGDAQFYSFTVSQSGTTDITLASLRSDAFTTLAAPVGIGVGAPAGTGCAATTTMNVTPGLTAQLSTTLSPGIYCADIYDVGSLKTAAAFAVRIVHP
jgi:hypothetical protein